MISLRFVLITAFIVLIISTVSLTGWLSFQNSQQAVNDAIHQLRNELTARVQQKLEDYLKIPVLLNQLNAEAAAKNRLPIGDFEQLKLHFIKQLQAVPSINRQYFSNPQGGQIVVVREGSEEFTLLHTENFTKGTLYTHKMNKEGKLLELLGSKPDYDVRTRPFHEDAVRAGRPSWSSIFPMFTTGQLLIAATHPIYDSHQELLGIFGVTFLLSYIDEFLRTLKTGPNGKVFIMERTGKMVAASTQQTTLTQQQSHVHEVAHPLIRSTARYLSDRFGDFTQIQQLEQLEFELAGNRHFLQVTPIADGLGIDWLIVVVIPEADFMGKINENARLTILLCLVALLAAILISLLIIRWMVNPIIRLNAVAKGLAQGDWEQKIHLEEIRRKDEVGQLAISFAKMAQQLQVAFTSLEEKVAQRTRELHEKNEALIKLNQEKNEFLGIAAHDLKNPLSVIKGLSEEVTEYFDEMSKEEIIDFMLKIQKSAHQMMELISNLLDVNAIESGRTDLSLEIIDILSVVHSLIAHYAQKAKTKGIVIELFSEEKADYRILAGRNPTHQILDNLISNAIKYSPMGKSIYLRLSTQDNMICCEIRDEGPGLSAEDQKKLFRKFTRLTPRPTAGEHSTGLGLFIVKKLVDAMHGKIGCHSELGKGTAFIVELPGIYAD